jgi:hypothetical protein
MDSGLRRNDEGGEAQPPPTVVAAKAGTDERNARDSIHNASAYEFPPPRE